MNAAGDRWPGRTWYQLEAGERDFAAPQGDLGCRVAIVGAGLGGISTALSLIERGIDDVVVLDADQPGAGASGRNGGFVFAGYSLGNEALIARQGAERAARLHGYTRSAIDLMRRRIERYAIDCQAVDTGVLLADWFGEPDRLREYADRMHRALGFRLEWIPPSERPRWVRSSRYGGGLHEPGSFHFNPLRHIRGLAGAIERHGGRVHGDCRVRAIEHADGRWRLRHDGGVVRAEEVVMATGGYDRRLAPSVQRAIQPVATYIAVTEPLRGRLDELLPRPVAVYDTRFAFDYYRPLPDGRLLWGGRISMASRSPAAIRRLMKRDLRRVFPALADVRFDFAWGGWMSYARHEMPLLGRTADGLWYALAFGGHGMATTTAAGEVMAEALLGYGSRLADFSAWKPHWAGGLAGRWAGQAIYWRAQLSDWWRDRRRAPGGRSGV